MTLLVIVGALTVGAGADLAAGPVETVAEGFQFTEGPVWLPGEGLIFSDIPADTIYRADKSVFRKPSGKSNGLTLDMEGRLIACEHWNRRVTRTEKDGTITVLADRYMGHKFNSPNDATVRSDGTIYFTDPGYGLEKRERELDFSGVYAISPEGGVTLLSVYFKWPNGLAFSPDEQTLYVGDSGTRFIQAFDVAEDGTLSNSRLFCRAACDGMEMDVEGRLWTSDGRHVSVFAPDGAKVGAIEFPQAPANCAFGGKHHKTLFVTARTAVYKVRVNTAGLRPGGGR